MRVLAITKIFPNAVEPLSSPFNRQQFAALAELCDVEVLASIPWFPGARAMARWSAADKLRRVPTRDVIDGIPVRHPRTLYLPKVGHGVAAPLYAASLAPAMWARYRGRIDVVLGSWAYPDGCAAIWLARLIGAPAVVKLHGSDINVVAAMPGPRRILRRVLPRAAAVVAVSRQLADATADLGVPRDRIHVVYNGVDAALFHPRDRGDARAELKLPQDRRLILYVGHLKSAKGVLDLMRAFESAAARAPTLSLAMVGDGEARPACERAAARLGDRVRLVGARPLAEIPTWMAACDALALPSWHEGTPNVLLEAVACGRRVVATAVGGIPDIVTQDAIGELVPARDPDALADALVRAARDYAAEQVAGLGARGGWAESAAALHRVLEQAAGGAGAAGVSASARAAKRSL